VNFTFTFTSLHCYFAYGFNNRKYTGGPLSVLDNTACDRKFCRSVFGIVDDRVLLLLLILLIAHDYKEKTLFVMWLENIFFLVVDFISTAGLDRMRKTVKISARIVSLWEEI
jgi:hypothetical protein